MATQAKVLRVLEEQQFTRVGGGKLSQRPCHRGIQQGVSSGN